MDRRRALSVAGLLLAAVVVLGLAWLDIDWFQGQAEDHLAKPSAEPVMDTDDARQALRTYFMDHYNEASCSAIYADLTHDGVEELLVLAVEDCRSGEPASLHSGALDADGFTRAQVTVLQVGENGAVLPIYGFTCGAEHGQWGELYLKKMDGADCLLWYAPYTEAGRSDFQLAVFSLCEDETALAQFREQFLFQAGGGIPQGGDADEVEVSAFLTQAEALLEDAEPVIVYDMIHDSVAGTGSLRRFAYLDALFTTF